jgi:hypothetical protein
VATGDVLLLRLGAERLTLGAGGATMIDVEAALQVEAVASPALSMRREPVMPFAEHSQR